jgi:hypothetical protein
MARRRSLQIRNLPIAASLLAAPESSEAGAKRARRPQGDGYISSGALMLLQRPPVNFSEKL